jgi:hypothetical protein
VIKHDYLPVDTCDAPHIGTVDGMGRIRQRLFGNERREYSP